MRNSISCISSRCLIGAGSLALADDTMKSELGSDEGLNEGRREGQKEEMKSKKLVHREEAKAEREAMNEKGRQSTKK